MFSIHCLTGHIFMPEKVVALAVEVCVVRDMDFATNSRWDAGRNIHSIQSVAKPVGIVAAICQQRPGLRDGG